MGYGSTAKQENHVSVLLSQLYYYIARIIMNHPSKLTKTRTHNFGKLLLRTSIQVK